jgi:hypothetical protein
LVALPGDNGPIQGIGSVFELLYLGGGFFLVPSALIFIKANPATSLGTIGIAQTLQKALFIGCCIALLPLLLMLGFSQVPGVLLFLATVAGLVFYAAQSTYTKEVLVNRG